LGCAFFTVAICYAWMPVELYWLPHSMVHSISYLAYSQRHTQLNMPKSVFAKTAPFLIVGALSATAFYGLTQMVQVEAFTHIAAPILWTVLVAHYLTDGMIWRTRRSRGVLYS
jgi:hypothetical protein